MQEESNQHATSARKTQQPSICLFGGTFDPIHLGHTHIAKAAVSALHLDRVLFLPCRESPHKKNQHHASANDRLAMCRLATKNLPWAEVSDIDLISPAPSYSWRTAETIHRQYPKARLFWLMGTDQWKALPQWNQPDRLSKLVEFIVFSRGSHATPRKKMRLHTIIGDHPASATIIRDEYKKNSSTHLTSWLHPDVISYINKHQLYTHKQQ